MTNFANTLTSVYDDSHISTAKITAVQSNGYAAETTTANIAILLTSKIECSVNDTVFYNIRTREIIEKSSVSSWIEIGV